MILAHVGLVPVEELVPASTGTTVEDMLAEGLRSASMLKRLPTLAVASDAAVFLVPDRAGATTGTTFELTGGAPASGTPSIHLGCMLLGRGQPKVGE